LKESLSKDKFLKIPYYTLITKGENTFNIFVPLLGIYGTAPSLDDAYSLLNDKKTEYYNNLDGIDALHAIPLPEMKKNGANSFRPSFIENIFSRILSLAIYLIFFVLLLLVLGVSIDKKLEKLSSKISSFENTPENKKIERIDRFKTKINELRPYVKEIKQLINEE